MSHRAISRPAHPRSRGENEYQARKSVTVRGSSPLTRGKPDTLTHTSGSKRLIPAHAGKTTQWYADWPYCPAHPRSRGENTSRTLSRSSGPGSSPLTRGKHSRRRAQLFDRGLIPAHAGKTFGGSLSSLPMTAHPRSRGENFFSVVSVIVVSGSSPLTRGKPAPYGPATMPASGSSPLTRGKPQKTL